jgi:predicted house-cleaning noncanonical NTP pyrophosphatase (MazG superfamily)
MVVLADEEPSDILEVVPSIVELLSVIVVVLAVEELSDILEVVPSIVVLLSV